MPISARYSATVGSLPIFEAMAANSAEPRYTLVFLPRRFGKLRVEVEIAVEPSLICAWLPMHSEQPGISVRAPAVPKVL